MNKLKVIPTISFLVKYCQNCNLLSIKSSIILGIMGEICEYITGKFMGTAKKNNAQVYEHNGLTPSK